jgi:Rv2258c-like winged HTH domain
MPKDRAREQQAETRTGGFQMTNPDLVKQFAGKLLNIYTGGVLTKLIDIGYEVGLFEASKGEPATSEELSERSGLNERYVR